MKKKLTTVLIITGVATVALVLAWYGMRKVPPDAARAWALVATLLLFPAALGGWFFGYTEARGRLAGIDQAVDKVMGAATKTAGLGLNTRRTARRDAQEPPSYVVLPDTEIVQRQLPRGSEIVEL